MLSGEYTLTFLLSFYLASILSCCLACFLTFFWLFYVAFCLESILTFFLASILAFYLVSYLASAQDLSNRFGQAVILASCPGLSHIVSISLPAILFGMPSVRGAARCILRSRYRVRVHCLQRSQYRLDRFLPTVAMSCMSIGDASLLKILISLETLTCEQNNQVAR